MNLLVKCLLWIIGLVAFDLVFLSIAGSGGIVSITVVMWCIFINIILSGVVLFRFIINPIIMLYNAVVVVDFDNDIIDFSKIDEMKLTEVKEIRFMQEKFKYLIDKLADRINRVNDEMYKSEHDKLTNCYNRTRLDRYKSNYEIAHSCCIIFIDVNNLKRMNDTFGHEAGDALIISASDHLRYWNTYGDVYRLGGDEFMVVITNKSEANIKNLFDAWYPTVGVLNRQTDGFKCVLSYGIAFTDAKFDFNSLQKIADDRMYDFKIKIKKEFGEPLR